MDHVELQHMGITPYFLITETKFRVDELIKNNNFTINEIIENFEKEYPIFRFSPKESM
jgi:hypothetical protein